MSERLPRKKFDEFYLSEGMLETLRSIGYSEPTPVQAMTIPLVMAGIDLIAQSQTGTGKTAAFAIPLVEMLEAAPGTIEVLVLAPTRELAKQVAEEFARLGSHKGINVATIYGGTGYQPQYDALETAQVVIATPGRLIDLADRGKLDFSQLRVFGLDEADEMLSMGFQEEVDRIIQLLPEERQSLLFSATITAEVKALGRSMLYYPEFLTASTDSVAAADVSHEYYAITGVGRARELLKILELEEPETAIVFANTRDDTFTVTNFLKRHGMRAEVLNGDLPQKERERTLAMLRAGEIDFLVATDVAARGIDISDLSHVFNYTVPDSAEVYIHRTGRTGRAGKKGKAISLISPREMATLFGIRKLYGVDMIKREPPTPNDILEAKKSRRIGQLSERMERIEQLPYGGALGLARQLVVDSDALPEADRIRLIARLIALADAYGKGSLPSGQTEAPKAKSAGKNGASAATNGASTEIAEVAEEEGEELFEAPAIKAAMAARESVEEEDAVEEAVESASAAEASAAEEEEPTRAPRERRSRRSSRRSSGDEDAPEKEAESVEAKEASDDDSEGGGRRRRRRRRGGRSETSDEATPASTSEAKTDESSNDSSDDDSSRDRSRRRRRGGRGRDRDRDRDRDRSSERRSSTPAPAPAAPAKPEMSFSKLWVNVGRNLVEETDQVVEMVCYMAGMEPEDLGEITLGNSYSYVEVREDYFYDIINALNNQDWNGVTVAAEPARK